MKKFTSNTQKIGKLGEEVACKYLKKHDFLILERNYTRKWGEIDIVAQKNKKIFFIEVKSVSHPLVSLETSDGGKTCEGEKEKNPFLTRRPEENMHPWKRKRLARTIETFLIHRRIGNTPWQFDLLLVFLDLKNRRAKVKTIENIIL